MSSAKEASSNHVGDHAPDLLLDFGALISAPRSDPSADDYVTIVPGVQKTRTCGEGLRT
jgi:hypothetical protein